MSTAVSPGVISSTEDGIEVEPSMMLHRPASARSQDVRHIITRTFGDLFTRDPISVDTIKNLMTTRGGDDEYHEKYVDSLQQVLEETESKLDEISMLEKHIMQAEAKALSADERHIYRNTEGQQQDLGLPISSNHYRSCIDYDLLKKHNLLTPDQYANYDPAKVTKPRPPPEPGYTQVTTNYVSNIKGKKEKKDKLRQSKFSKTETERLLSLSNTKVSQLNSTLSVDDVDRESVDYMKDGSEAGDTARSRVSLHQESTEVLPVKKQRKVSQRKWTDELSVEQREKEKSALEQLQNRANYLKNPRFDRSQAKLLTAPYKPASKEINVRKVPAEVEPIDKVQVFVATPSVVTFTEYQVGQVYEATLELKNVSTSLRPVRILPTTTNYFSVGLGQFPGEQGLVASGMSAQFRIRFMPDSLGEYLDEIHVQSQCTEPLVIKVVAKRPPPILTLPSVVEIGECLIGGTKVCKLLVRNDGGDGKFCLLPKEKWPATNFRSNVNPTHLDIAPFQIRPAIFELQHKETTLIEVVFRPTSLGSVSVDVLTLCDNCQMKQFTFQGQGQMAAVEFVAVDGGTSEKESGESCDVSATKLIRFDNLNPFTYTQKNLILSNVTNVALPFEWMVVKPHIASGCSEDSTTPSSRSIDGDSAFSIEPQNGILEASGIANFRVTFAPPEVNKYHSVLHLLLPGIPQIEDLSESLSKSAKPVLKDVTSLELECKAECVPLKVVLQPYAIYVNGKSLLGTTVRRTFTFVNNSVSAAAFQWEVPADGNILEVTPALGEVGPMMTADMEVSITGCGVGKMHEVLWCHVKNLAEPVALHVDFEVKGPEVFIDEPDLNFGLVRFGETASATLTLHSDSQMPAKYELREKLPANQVQEKSEFIFTPQKGEMKPLETRKVSVQFYPQVCRQLMTFFELTVADGGEPRTVAVRADVQSSDVCLLSSCLHIARLFVNMPMTQTITLINKSMLPTEYTWGQPFGSQVDLCEIKLKECGELGPNEQAEIELTFTAREQVDMSDIILPCHVAGMDEPLLLSIMASVEGLQVAYAIQDSPNLPNFDEANCNSRELDYGVVPVKATAKKYLYIRNKTSIPTEYRISLKNFSSRPPTPPASRFNKPIAGKALLQRTANIADPNSKNKERALIELQQQLLKTDKGLAIVPTPAQGSLGPYEQLVVELTLYNDMWGEYEDTLTCQVGDLKPYDVSVKAIIKGVPLQFHMAAVTKDPTLRGLPHSYGAEQLNYSLKFGTHASNAKSITRTVRINNHTPVDVRLDWQLFNVVPEDQQLVDFVVSYGDPFPKKDADGNVIEEVTCSPEPLSSRPSTEVILDTPDSTPVPSGPEVLSATSSRPVSADVLLSQPPSDPLITVFLRPHHGHTADMPFSIQPEQMVIPARDKGFISVTFNPKCGNPMGEDCHSYILGYLNLEPKNADVPGKVNRAVGYQMEPMRLNLAGCIEPALLNNEYTDDEGLRFRGVASDLMRDGVDNPKAYYTIRNGTKLTNLTEALLSFKVDVRHPFVFTHSIPTVGEDNCISLRPSDSSEVYIDFCITPDQLELINQFEESSEDRIGQLPVVVVRRNGERQIHFSETLKLLFASGSVQDFPLHASLTLPSLSVSANHIDFGICLAGQPKQKTFIIRNHTSSDSYWSLRGLELCKNSDKETFVMAPNSGHLEAHIAHVTRSEALVTVTFAARHSQRLYTLMDSGLGKSPLDVANENVGVAKEAVGGKGDCDVNWMGFAVDRESGEVAMNEGSKDMTYKSSFTLSGVLGEEPVIITAVGRGSYDEKYRDPLGLVVDPKATG